MSWVFRYIVFVCIIVAFPIISAVFAVWNSLGTTAFGGASIIAGSATITDDNKIYGVASRAGDGYPFAYRRDGTTWPLLNEEPLEPNIALTAKVFNDGNQLYVGYQSNSGSKLAVMKHIGSGNWDFVGEKGVSSGSATAPDFDIDQNGNIYAAFRDGAFSSRVNVMKRDGTGRAYLGGTGVSAASANLASIEVVSDQEIYLAYRDSSGGGGGRVTVRKRNGSAWSNVGGLGIGSGNTSTYISLLHTPLNELYVAYSDGSVSQKITVLQWDGSSWNYLGGLQGFSTGEARYIKTESNSSGDVYVAYSDISQTKHVVVKKWTGIEWLEVGGNGGISEAGGTVISLLINKFNKIFVTYADTISLRLVVKSREEPYTCFSQTGDACITDVGAGEVTVVSIRSPLESLSLFFDLGWQNNVSTLFSGSYASLGQSGYFVVEDSAGDDAGYYTTVQSSDLVGLSGATLPASNISMSASDSDIVVLDGLTNSDVHVNISSGSFLDNAQTLLYRTSGYNNHRVGTYGVAPNVYIDIPAYQQLDVYSGTITYTLFYNN